MSIFYDGFHPTEVANSVFATRSYNAQSPTDASPYDISQLAALWLMFYDIVWFLLSCDSMYSMCKNHNALMK